MKGGVGDKEGRRVRKEELQKAGKKNEAIEEKINMKTGKLKKNVKRKGRRKRRNKRKTGRREGEKVVGEIERT